MKYNYNCAVPGCSDRNSTRIHFPTDPDLLEKWCNAVRNCKVTPHAILQGARHWRVCMRHFADEDKLPELRRKVKFNAVPVLNLPACNSEEFQAVSPPSKRPRLSETTSGPRARRSLLHSFSVSRQSFLTPRRKKAYRCIKESGISLRKQLGRFKSFRERLANAESFSESPGFQRLLSGLNKPTYNLVMCQVRNQHRLPKARRYTLSEKVLCLTLLKAGGRGYRLLSRMFALPSKKTLHRLLSLVPVQPGLNCTLVESLRKAVSEMDDMSRCAVLVWDEIFIDVGVSYNCSNDLVEGLESLKTKPAKALFPENKYWF